MTTFLVAAFLATFAVLMVAVAITVRVDRIATYDAGLAELDHSIDVDRHCAQAGHRYVKVPVPTRWRCAICGDVVESKAGWVA